MGIVRAAQCFVKAVMAFGHKPNQLTTVDQSWMWFVQKWTCQANILNLLQFLVFSMWNVVWSQYEPVKDLLCSQWSIYIDFKSMWFLVICYHGFNHFFKSPRFLDNFPWFSLLPLQFSIDFLWDFIDFRFEISSGFPQSLMDFQMSH